MEENSRDIEFMKMLETTSDRLIDCQKGRELESCFPCENWEGCVIREEYVKAVYSSMAKGTEGGFEF
jgi:hypothetical protein